ncbi:MAG TPA: hypothetical protein VKD02_04065 [Methyloceanibacter sp.]|nr:hypothetical protein [Methyloceanibacter sp.]
MRFFIGALALLVIVVVVGSPAALLLGWMGIADLRQIAITSTTEPAPVPAAQPAPR